MVRYDNAEVGLKEKIMKTPIIIFPFYTPGFDFIVVDGNKRLTRYVNEKKTFTKARIINTIYPEFFLFSVDWAMFICLYEVNSWLKSVQDFSDCKIFQNGILNMKIFNEQLNHIFLSKSNMHSFHKR